jgi:hypothetical protein
VAEAGIVVDADHATGTGLDSAVSDSIRLRVARRDPPHQPLR